jgi:hypothetical protein
MRSNLLKQKHLMLRSAPLEYLGVNSARVSIARGHPRAVMGRNDSAISDADTGCWDYNPCPPATAMDCPVTQEANGEARNSATLAISSAWPMRPNGIEASVLL